MNLNYVFSLTAACCIGSAVAGVTTKEESYLVGEGNTDFTFKPLLTVGDRVPLTGSTAGEEYTLVGIPDATGIYKDAATGENIFFVAHELARGVTTQPFPGASKKLQGAFVSRYVLADDGSVVEGGIAHESVVTKQGEISNPDEDSATAFTRFCSGSFAGRHQGLDRPFFFTNEESTRTYYDFDAVFDANEETGGALSVAVADGKLYTLDDLGRVPRENTIVQPRRDRKTVVISTEDGGYPSYVYMYVGEKKRMDYAEIRSQSLGDVSEEIAPETNASTQSNALYRNGLVGGKIYVLSVKGAKDNAALQQNAATFTAPGAANAIDIEWVEIPNGKDMRDDALEQAADAAGGFAFTRVEDADFDPAKPTRTLFVAATGGRGPNRLGRLYEVSLDPRNPESQGKMAIVYNTDLELTPGGSMNNASNGRFFSVNGGNDVIPEYVPGPMLNKDFPVSVDNIAVSADYIVICEDRNSPADEVFAKNNRNGGVWTLDRNNNYAAKLQSTFNYSYVEARDNHSSIAVAKSPGTWESTGVISTDHIFGKGSFLIAVQAHDTTVTQLDENGEPVADGDEPVTKKSIRTNIPNGKGGNYTVDEAVDLFNEDGQVILMQVK